MLLFVGLPHEKAQPAQVLEGDWFGILGLIIGSAAHRGAGGRQREQWFASNLIVSLSVAATFGFVLLAIRAVHREGTRHRMSILRTRAFGSVFLMSFAPRRRLYGILYLIPQFLSQVPRTNAEQAGHIVLLSGVPTR